MLFLAAGLVLFSNTPSAAQNLNKSQLWEFSDRKSNPITTGSIVSLNSATIEVLDGLGELHSIKIKTLSNSSRQFVQSLVQVEEKRQTSNAEVQKLLKKLKSKSVKLKIKALNNIANFGEDAVSVAPEIATIAETNEDEIGLAAFYSFLAICPVEDTSAKIANRIINQNPVVKLDIKSNPLRYFKHLTRLAGLQEDTIIQAAFKGVVDTPPLNSELLLMPETLVTNSGNKNRIRSIAAYSLAFIKTKNSREAMFKTLKAAERQINGRNDIDTILAIYTGCAEYGWQFTAVNSHMDLYKKYKAVFKTQASQWEENWKKRLATRQEQERLQRSSKMRNFKNQKGDFLMRGKVETVKDSKVLFTDHNTVRRTLELSQFSQSDIKWLFENVGHN